MVELDLSGLNCPLPILKTKKFLAEIEHGTEVRIMTTDPASIADFKDFCSKTGNIILTQTKIGALITTVIQKRPEEFCTAS